MDGPARCLVCRQAPATFGALCDGCRRRLTIVITITPEQIAWQGTTGAEDAALVDMWGRVFRLWPHTTIGRNISDQGLAILEGSVSRQHASLVYERGTWTLTDHGSSNGTYIHHRALEAPVVLAHGDVVGFGKIAFFFADKLGSALAPRPKRAISETPEIAMSTTPTLRIDRRGLATMAFALQEPTGGGGGLIEIDGTPVQLTTAQFELMALLIERMAIEAEAPYESRGFVTTEQLAKRLSLDSVEPAGDNVRQLVRRLRRALNKANIPDLIETRPGQGYRLRVIPKLK